MDRLTFRLALLLLPMILFRPLGLNVARLCVGSTPKLSMLDTPAPANPIERKPSHKPEYSADGGVDGPMLISQIVASSEAIDESPKSMNEGTPVGTEDLVSAVSQSEPNSSKQQGERRVPQGFDHLWQASIPDIEFVTSEAADVTETSPPSIPSHSGPGATKLDSGGTVREPEAVDEHPNDDWRIGELPALEEPRVTAPISTPSRSTPARSVRGLALDSLAPTMAEQPEKHRRQVPEPQFVKSRPPTESRTTVGEWKRVDLRGVVAQPSILPEAPSTPKPAPQPSRAAIEQARHALQSGFSLASRRAHYSARARFVEVLRIVAQSLDEQTLTNRHARSLANAMSALKEAADFLPRANVLEGEMELESVITAHRTPVLKDVDVSDLTTTQCLQEYFAYAEQELTYASGHLPVTSQALFGLAKLQIQSASPKEPAQIKAARAITLYQAALVADGRNFYAANELGVLLARYGQFQDARLALRHCLRLAPREVVWRNLADVHERLGEHQYARLALQEAELLAQRRTTGEGPTEQPHHQEIEWVDPQTFANSHPNDPWRHQAAGSISVPNSVERMQAQTNRHVQPRIR